MEQHTSTTRRSTRRSTGPRTAAGKRRSRSNALKFGIFSHMLLSHESAAEHEWALQEFRKYFRPVGLPEDVLVQELVTIVWRRRRLIAAETAEISKGRSLDAADSVSAQLTEAWDVARAGDSSGGILRHSENIFVLRDAIGALSLFRCLIAEVGIAKELEPRILRRLYGLNHDGSAPIGLLNFFEAMSATAISAAGRDDSESVEILKQSVLDELDVEIVRLETLLSQRQRIEQERLRLQQTASLVPIDVERLIRNEAHLSREFNRSVRALQSLQRSRLGRPDPPEINVDIAS